MSSPDESRGFFFVTANASIEVRAVDNRTPHEQLTELLGQVRSMGIAVPDVVKAIE